MEKGYRSGRLLTIEQIQKTKLLENKRSKWLCKCDCGNEKVILEDCLKSKRTKSCGCIKTLNKKDYFESSKKRILEKIEKNENGCWIFNSTNHLGYGRFWFNKREQVAHRVTWQIFKGEIPLGLLVLHKCDNPSCCNPEHMFLGTQKDNIQDAIKKERFDICRRPPVRSKLKYDEVVKIKELYKEGMTQSKLKNMFSVSFGCIAKILRGDSWKINWTQEL